MEHAHRKIGDLLSPLNLLRGHADRVHPDEDLIGSLLATEQFVGDWKEEWLPKFRELHVLPVEVLGVECHSYHDAVCGMGGLFAHDVCRRFHARDLGETTWDVYFAAVAENAVGRWEEFLQLWKDSCFARVDRNTLWDQFLDEGRRAVEDDRKEGMFSRPRSPAEWRRIFKHLNEGVPYSEKGWQKQRDGRLAPYLTADSSKSVRIRLDCPLLPDDFDDAKRY